MYRFHEADPLLNCHVFRMMTDAQLTGLTDVSATSAQCCLSPSSKLLTEGNNSYRNLSSLTEPDLPLQDSKTMGSSVLHVHPYRNQMFPLD
jgi:hypothetical protein